MTETFPTPTDRAAATKLETASVPRRPLFATILWGVLLLSFAAFMVTATLLPGALDPTLWLLGGVIAVGLVLVIAGIAAASRRAG